MRAVGFSSNPILYSQIRAGQFHKPNTAAALAKQLLQGAEMLKDASKDGPQKLRKKVGAVSDSVFKNPYQVSNYKLDSLMKKENREFHNKALQLFHNSNQLSLNNNRSVFNEPEISQSRSEIADITPVKEIRRGNRGFELKVDSVAKQQISGFEEVKSGKLAETPESGFKIHISGNEYDIRSKSGKSRTNDEVLQELAEKVNQLSAGVLAKVEKKHENSSLKLQSDKTGAQNAFRISEGDGLTKASKLLQSPADAVYHITDKGFSKKYQSDSNDIRLDYYGVKATLKKEGKTSVGFDEPNRQKITDSVESMLRDYNRLSDLSKERDRDNKEKALMISEQQRERLKKIGIDYNKNTNRFSIDKKRQQLALENNLDDIKQAISGSNGLASQIKEHAHEALSKSLKETISNQFNKSLDMKSAHNYGVNHSWSNNQPVLSLKNIYGFDRAFNFGLSFGDGFL